MDLFYTILNSILSIEILDYVFIVVIIFNWINSTRMIFNHQRKNSKYKTNKIYVSYLKIPKRSIKQVWKLIYIKDKSNGKNLFKHTKLIAISTILSIMSSIICDYFFNTLYTQSFFRYINF